MDFTRKLTLVDPLGIGFTCSTYSGNGQANINRNTMWKQQLRALAPAHVRIPLRWNKGNPGSSAGGAQTSGDADLYVKNINGLGAIPYVIYGGDNSDNGGLNPADAAAFVHHYNDPGVLSGGPVKYWVVGNEADNGGGSAAYLAALPGIVAAMHNADPSIRISAPAAAYWDTNLLSAAAKVPGVDDLDYHAYNGEDPAPNGFPNEDAYHQHIAVDIPKMFPGSCGVTECNWHFAGGDPAFFDWRNTCFIADAAGQVLSGGGHFTQYSDSNGALGLLNDGNGQGQPGVFGTPLPAYWGVGIWTGMRQFKTWSGAMCPVTTGFSSTTLSAFACSNGKIVLVNKSANPLSLTIAMNGKTTGTYQVWATNRNSPTSPITMPVNGTYVSGTIDYVIPAGTAVSVDVN